MRKKGRYQWPASALTDPELMAHLKRLSSMTKTPINVLIRQATERFVTDFRDRMDDPEARDRVLYRDA